MGLRKRGGSGERSSPGDEALRKKPAANGSAMGCNQLGLAYQNGLGVAQDMAQAGEFFRTACDASSTGDLGCNNLGLMYQNGRGVTKESRRGTKTLSPIVRRKPADRLQQRGRDVCLRTGCGAGRCGGAGTCFARRAGLEQPGVGVRGSGFDAGERARCAAKNEPAAIGLFQKACRWRRHGWMPRPGRHVPERPGSSQGTGKQRQPASMAKPATRAWRAHGHEPGRTPLLANGQGVTKDEAKAFILYQKACSGGDTNGCFSVALAYYTGKGVAKDLPQAASLYRKSCDAGNELSCTNLGARCISPVTALERRTTTRFTA